MVLAFSGNRAFKPFKKLAETRNEDAMILLGKRLRSGSLQDAIRSDFLSDATWIFSREKYRKRGLNRR